MVSTVDSYEDAEWIKSELEMVGIPARIHVHQVDPEIEGNSADVGEKDLEDGGNFDIMVVQRHVLAAVDLVQSLLQDETRTPEKSVNADEWMRSDDASEAEDPSDFVAVGENSAAKVNQPLAILIIILPIVLLVLFSTFSGFSPLI